MYLFPSTSVTMQPSPCLINNGVPPTALNARTGDETPPGISLRARAKAASELAIDRWTAAVGAAGLELPELELGALRSAIRLGDDLIGLAHPQATDSSHRGFGGFVLPSRVLE